MKQVLLQQKLSPLIFSHPFDLRFHPDFEEYHIGLVQIMYGKLREMVPYP